MSKLILLAGDLATGKTTFSQILAKRYQIDAYTKDEIKELLADDIGFTNREENLKLSRAAVNLMTLIYKKHAQAQKDLILEANFHRDEILEIQSFALERGDSLLILLFEADTAILYERFRHRIECENRHPAHQSANLNSLDAFRSYVLDSRKGLEVQGCIKVNSGDFSYQSDNKLLARIDDFMRKEN